MHEASCVELLKWALPKLGLAWSGFRRVHRQVCKRVSRRLGELHLPDCAAYRDYLERNPAEWDVLATFCRIPISRFFRDAAVFDCLEREVLPSLARIAIAQDRTVLTCWSAGCAAGEEPYSLSILWHYVLAARFPSLSIDILATDLDEHQLERARAALYRPSSLSEVPPDLRGRAFERLGELYLISTEARLGVAFDRQDFLQSIPPGPFDMVLCRNAAFTYCSQERQRTLLPRLCTALRAGGALVVGLRERLPQNADSLVPWFPQLGIFRNPDEGFRHNAEAGRLDAGD